MNSIRSDNQSLKYKRFPPSGCKDIGIRQLDFVARTPSLSSKKKTIVISSKFCGASNITVARTLIKIFKSILYKYHVLVINYFL